MPKLIRNTEVVERCRRLYKDGHSMPQIAERIPKEFTYIKSIHPNTIFNAIHFGVNTRSKLNVARPANS